MKTAFLVAILLFSATYTNACDFQTFIQSQSFSVPVQQVQFQPVQAFSVPVVQQFQVQHVQPVIQQQVHVQPVQVQRVQQVHVQPVQVQKVIRQQVVQQQVVQQRVVNPVQVEVQNVRRGLFGRRSFTRVRVR